MTGGCTVGLAVGSALGLAMAWGEVVLVPGQGLTGMECMALGLAVPRWSASSWTSGNVGQSVCLVALFTQGCVMIAAAVHIAGLSLSWTSTWGKWIGHLYEWKMLLWLLW